MIVDIKLFSFLTYKRDVGSRQAWYWQLLLACMLPKFIVKSSWLSTFILDSPRRTVYFALFSLFVLNWCNAPPIVIMKNCLIWELTLRQWSLCFVVCVEFGKLVPTSNRFIFPECDPKITWFDTWTWNQAIYGSRYPLTEFYYAPSWFNLEGRD